MGAQVHAIMSKDKTNLSDSPPCVFNALVVSALPAHEKTVERLRGEGQTLIGAGTLTTAFVLKTVLFHVLDNPELLERLSNELNEAFPDAPNNNNSTLDLAELEKLPFLTACITEGLRMAYGVTHRIQLIAPHETLKYQEHEILPGTPVSMTSIFMHDNPSVFPQPRTFRPQRWLDAERASHLYRYLVPFSRGTRMCLGMHLAWAELYLVLGCLFKRYRFELHETTMADVEMAHDFFDPSPRLDSKGLRVRVERI
jgi:cytochrome P450